MEELLRQSGLTIIAIDGKYIDLAHGYRVEIENDSLFKLTHEGSVIAPFDDGAELVEFVLMDMRLNGIL
jgi:hypothetical protein